eukprot:2537982-Rhodomonas_salina.3
MPWLVMLVYAADKNWFKTEKKNYAELEEMGGEQSKKRKKIGGHCLPLSLHSLSLILSLILSLSLTHTHTHSHTHPYARLLARSLSLAGAGETSME